MATKVTVLHATPGSAASLWRTRRAAHGQPTRSSDGIDSPSGGDSKVELTHLRDMTMRLHRLRLGLLAPVTVAGVAVAGMATTATLLPQASAQPLPQVTAYRTASCGCCKGWLQHMRANGFQVRDVVVADLGAIKRRLGIPAQLSSCHSAQVAGFALEGHIPASDVRLLLRKRPAVAGIALPGMPLGSPGMESAYGKEPFTVMSFTRDGRMQRFSHHPA